MPKKIGFTYNVKSEFPLKVGDPEDLNAEFDNPQTIDLVKSAIESGGHEVILIGNAKNLLKMLPDLKVDIIFNICEGIGSRNREAQIPVILETLGIPYVGSDGLTMSLALDKVMAKKVFAAEKIPTPGCVGIKKMEDLVNLDHLEFPLIVKLRQEGTSKGLANDSVVHNRKELEKKSEYLFGTYHNAPIIIEQFIPGKEITVPIIGNSPPEALPSVQLAISGITELEELIYTYEMVKSPDVDYLCPSRIDKQLESQLGDLAVRAYKAVDCLDFGRVDFRVDKNNNPYVLEINPLPSLAFDDVFNLSPQVVGYDYNKAINKILDAALLRYGLN
ncbi:MAG: ATP-grasp domain-containing protein [Candidatus Omnitrophica bacterium]|nr:ATP-grasp domain-containing protein [Candidatus Omnitrophota bacterium]MDD5351679.1 ATP-grasp domain-containing protein [Candidatus Omnitrophota bacterium]MDD5550889.1 ATP-grasp domain-containing protein [Candidatus Omnitrophota bacterium]